MGQNATPTAERALIGALRAAGCVYAEDEAALLLAGAADPAELAAMVARRVAGVPLEHILGWAEFCGTRVAVAAGVFVPRRRTEFLVHEALRVLRPGAIVVDLCSGSGAVALALALAAAPLEVHAVDCDPAAGACMRQNLGAVGGHAYQGDLYAPLPRGLRGRVDVLVANAPYVPTDGIRLLPPEARNFEPRMALDGGVDGLAVARRIVAAAREWLGRDGRLLIETSTGQAADLMAVMAQHGLGAETVRSDEFDATVVIASMPG